MNARPAALPPVIVAVRAPVATVQRDAEAADELASAEPTRRMPESPATKAGRVNPSIRHGMESLSRRVRGGRTERIGAASVPRSDTGPTDHCHRLARPLQIERESSPDRGAMVAALRVALGLPRALPSPDEEAA